MLHYCIDLSVAFQAFLQFTVKVFLFKSQSSTQQLKCFFRKRRYGPDRQNVSRQHEGQQKKSFEAAMTVNTDREVKLLAWVLFFKFSPPTQAFSYSNLEKTQNL